ncbi:hypothetical protein [Candidatus Chloroploca asiatica]|uniref:Peptidase M28 domain-containing protein n=1 Tax=Candidatus Chloroploca asiatica TaxID=1506545 RepID=A0A2H3L6S5_9CHLR|nr:hypothetical protein [Candidatus Chloroploca asiatica]PDV97969.1 hypothetical protein A9Q02_16655 [Candidatus Chloroploca asiatica]
MYTPIRDDTRELEVLVSQLADQTGSRLATSQGEATVAAFVNGRLRHAGMGVGTYEVRVVPHRGHWYRWPALLGLVAALLTPLLPLPSLLLAVIVFGWFLLDSLGMPLPPPGRRYASQNIVGTRAITGAMGLEPAVPRWRVLLLAPLDMALTHRGLAALCGIGTTAGLARVAIATVTILASGMSLFLPGLPWLISLPGGLGYLLLLIAALRPPTPASPDGGLATLATMLAAVQRLGALTNVEVWAVAVGAVASDQRGVTNLLRRFPFDRARTLCITLEPLVGNQVVIASREQAGGVADPLLLELALEADTADPQIDAEPQILAQRGRLASILRRHGYRTVTILARPAPGALAQNSDSAAIPRLVERTTRLIVGIVRGLEAKG